MAENQVKKTMWEVLNPQQTFFVGLVGGVLVLCTIGFFVLLGIMFNREGEETNLFGGLTGGDDTSTDTTTDGSGTAVVKGPAQFSACLDTGKYANAVSQDEQLGASIGVNGTPATFINGYLISGALPYDSVKQVVDAVLAGKKPDFEFLKDDSGNIAPVTMPNLPNAIWRGNENAKVTIVEFSDFECPYCNRFEPTMAQILNDYKDKVKFTYRNFPLSFHANAQKAAEAFECAKEQGKGFEMHDKLFELSRQSKLSVSAFNQAANELKLK
ncbi:MAG: thioredoxin domain-containing protein [Candidatus Magasanikbacteria bacterium]